jgi:hypothetical protein
LDPLGSTKRVLKRSRRESDILDLYRSWRFEILPLIATSHLALLGTTLSAMQLVKSCLPSESVRCFSLSWTSLKFASDVGSAARNSLDGEWFLLPCRAVNGVPFVYSILWFDKIWYQGKVFCFLVIGVIHFMGCCFSSGLERVNAGAPHQTLAERFYPWPILACTEGFDFDSCLLSVSLTKSLELLLFVLLSLAC